MTLYVYGTAHIPSRFWKLNKEADSVDRPAITLSKTEEERYDRLLCLGISNPCQGDVLDKFKGYSSDW